MGCEDSTPVRGASYEPPVLFWVSAELRLSRIRVGVVMLGVFLGFFAVPAFRRGHVADFFPTQRNNDDDKPHETEAFLRLDWQLQPYSFTWIVLWYTTFSSTAFLQLSSIPTCFLHLFTTNIRHFRPPRVSVLFAFFLYSRDYSNTYLRPEERFNDSTSRERKGGFKRV